MQLRKSAHPNPTIKFFNVDRLRRPIDTEDDEESVMNRVNYDVSEDEEEVDLKPERMNRVPPPPSTALPMDGGDDKDISGEDVDLASAELKEILADKPISRVNKTKGSRGITTKAPEGEDEEEGGNFELSAWI